MTKKFWLSLFFLASVSFSFANDIFIGNSVKSEPGLRPLVGLLPSVLDNFRLSWKLTSSISWVKTDEILKHHESQCLSASGSLYRLLRNQIIDDGFEFYPVAADLKYYGHHAFLKIVKKTSNEVWYLDTTIKQFEKYKKRHSDLELPKIFFGNLREYKKKLLLNQTHGLDPSFEDHIEKSIKNAQPLYIFLLLTGKDWIDDCRISLFNHFRACKKRFH